MSNVSGSNGVSVERNRSEMPGAVLALEFGSSSAAARGKGALVQMFADG